MVGQPDKTEASAMSAYDELMEEENQAAAKAAAKKAKKLKQKSKKQQAQLLQIQPLDEAQSNADEGPSNVASGSGANAPPAVTTPPQSPGPRPAHLQAALTPPRHGTSLHDGALLISTAGLNDTAILDGSAEPSESPVDDLSLRFDALHVTGSSPDREDGTSRAGGDVSAALQSTEGVDSQGMKPGDSDDQFLKALFCCPLTKVTLPSAVLRVVSNMTHHPCLL